MDTYTKAILAIIAAALVGINFQMFRPDPAKAGLFDGAPTISDILALREMKDAKKKEEARRSLMGRIPIVKVYGTVSVDSIDGEIGSFSRWQAYFAMYPGCFRGGRRMVQLGLGVPHLLDDFNGERLSQVAFPEVNKLD